MPHREGAFGVSANFFYRVFFDDATVARCPTPEEVAAAAARVPGTRIAVQAREGMPESAAPCARTCRRGRRDRSAGPRRRARLAHVADTRPNERSRARPAWLGDLGAAVFVGLAYYAGAWFGVQRTVTDEGIAVLWPPNAVLLAAFLLFPPRRWPAIALAAFAAELAADLPTFPLGAAVAFGAVNLFETTLAAVAIRRVVPGRFAFDTLRNALAFLLLGPVAASAVAAVFGATVYVVLGRADTSFLELWRLWWFGDALGLLLLTPLIVAVVRRFLSEAPARPPWARSLEAGALFGSVLVVGALVSLPVGRETPALPFTPMVLVPLGVWGAVRFGVLGAAATVALIAVQSVERLVQGADPYGGMLAEHAVWLTQEYLSVMAVVTVGLAVLLDERERQERALRARDDELREQNVLLERRIEERTHDLEQANASLQQANVRLERFATIDYLTGFANRRHFEATCRQTMQRLARDGRPASIVLFDIDHFKAVNDRHGHAVGDAVLRGIVAPVRASVRSHDPCGRLGGEEFAIFLADEDENRGLEIAERLRERIEAMSVEHVPDVVRVTASFGVAAWDGEADYDGLLHEADEALFRAKRAGRNRVAS